MRSLRGCPVGVTRHRRPAPSPSRPRRSRTIGVAAPSGWVLSPCAGVGRPRGRLTHSASATVAVAAAALLAAGCGSPATHAAGRATPALQRCPPAAPAGQSQLPAVTLPCLDGGPAVGLSHLPARPYIVNLWASWCTPCQAEAPRLAAAASSAHGRVGFLGIDNNDGAPAARAFLARYGIRYPQVSDPHSTVGHRLGLPGIPVTLALDAHGRIVYRRIGEISSAQLAAAVRAATHPSAPAGGGA